MRSHVFPLTVFLKSVAQLDQLPTDQGVEVAFIGRSNSGKSTAINSITGKKGLAKTSKIPGRTQLLNFFQINEQLRLVDLPGYGFANVPNDKKTDWEKTIATYLKTRKSLKGLVITMDIRHPLKDRDQAMLTWASHYQIPVYILLTKADKLTRNQAENVLKLTTQQLATLNQPYEIQIFSATKSIGLTSVRHRILNWLHS
ncbi:YihA family ribosome biogenesis GTP-binding protein [Candidatus Rickettsiella isopodorum]|uniref:Probable GTP-binding protein EngB n=1 Tax=Candidatus Rickettsiella isopodorum TaxID=1225476 RepID=A0A1J8NHX9_9COXI|nr:ribosome biogenesis GTP-binding protein YihA/YsxC [Candidatus Rickettsiella isopodorum]MCH9636505.1 ribosome biogenesis GTP-binding protein YihA/YsxC [Gammaproteobacteria bacterium]MDQ5899415.1 putative GTP-binding protein EngB [Pseudomonadota bacterium]MCH9754911.1 ribosome biogenesis GTP-binding protein YihA/YsxC [Gammaproteobacteria bacterium]MDD4892494.1 ribosome biogenesis GTP-binding protein YihA/YsxC [Candidatus Rickettsiella isopodorum]MDD5161360.1 ribosome biogenesis GTP-binding pr